MILSPRFWLAPLLLLLASAPLLAEDAKKKESGQSGKVSYYRDIRPIFQAQCHGCHQPAKQSGEYLMTEFARLVQGGESDDAAIVPGKPEESYLIEQITPDGEEAAMPKSKPPLKEARIELIKQWIAQGAKDDSPESDQPKYDMDHPPVYNRPPVLTSLDYSPDGKLLAVSGYHEVLLHKADGSGLVARLVGMSARIESAVFSSDGKRLAVTGGSPGRRGEVQIWDVARRKLTLSVPVTYDTLYGVSWSPDGKLVSFGCSDNTLRVVEADTGKQVLYSGAHDGWVLDSVFSAKGTHVISVSRDRSMKLVELKTQRFIDNITSITPGALSGGLHAVARHPTKDELLIGGADGVPKIYRVFRTTKRVIGDDANLVRKFPKMLGRIFDVAISRDGTMIAAASSYNGTGAVSMYAYDFDSKLPDNIAAIVVKVSFARSAAEKAQLEKYRQSGIKLLASMEQQEGGVYAVTFSPDGKVVASGGFDGVVRLNDAKTGKFIKKFVPVDVQKPQVATAGEP